MTSSKSRRHPNIFKRATLAFLIVTSIAAAAVLSSPTVSSRARNPQQRDLERVFNRHDRLNLNPAEVTRQVRETGSLTLSTSRGIFEMTLEPHDMRAPGYRAESWGDQSVRVLERGPVRTYKGTVRGLPAAQARMTIDEEIVEGLIITPSELLFLEPTARYSRAAAKTDFVFYAGSDVKEPAGECETTAAHLVTQHSASAASQVSAKGPQPEAIFGPALEIGIALEADFEYFSLFNSEAATVDQMLTIMNEVDGIYNAQMGLKYSIVFTRVWSTSNDPYTSPVPPETAIAANTALNEFRNSYNASPPAGAAGRDLAHLFMGRDFTGNTIGIAFLSALDCPFNPQGVGYGISQNISGNRAGLTAHEIGHNLSATHVSSTQGSDCTQSIMNPSISTTQDFCQFSRDQITSHAITQNAENGCLTPLNQPGCTYSLSQSTQNLPSGDSSVSVEVTTQAGCNWAVAEGEAWVTITNPTGVASGSGTVTYSVTSNSICGPRTGLVAIGDKILTVIQAGSPNYLTDPITATAIGPGPAVSGDLSAPDCVYGLVGTSGGDQRNAFMDRYKFFGMAGQKIRIDMNATTPPQSGGLDTFLYLYGPDGMGGFAPIAENDDIVLGSQTDSRIPCVSPCNVTPAFLTLPETGTYIIIATSFGSGDTGGYSLTLTSEPLLLTEQGNGNVAVALNSVTFTKTSNPPANTAFRIFDPHNFSSDQITRLILFTSDLGLAQQQTPSSSDVSVSAGGRQLVVENVGPFTFPGLSGSYVIVSLGALNNNPQLTGNLAFTLTSRGQTSNITSITIVP